MFSDNQLLIDDQQEELGRNQKEANVKSINSYK
jgi:hypothetical protein